MGGLLIGRLHASVTFGAGYMTVNGLRKFLGVNQHLFPWLQRSHFAPSANSFGFAFASLFFWFGSIYQALLIRMTAQTFVLFRDCCLSYGRYNRWRSVLISFRGCALHIKRRLIWGDERGGWLATRQQNAPYNRRSNEEV
jgi:hypothetical protein